jgi:hypothetical protein
MTTKTALKKVSSLRTWGPAMVAVALVIAINSALFSGGMPELSDRAQRKLALTADRLAAIEQMEASSFEVTSNGFGSRNLSEEEGGVMEYTRRRHRYLGDYVHKDVSDDFSAFGKWSTSLIYFAFWVLQW